MPFRNSAVVAATLATNRTGNRVEISAPVVGNSQEGQVRLYTGAEGANGSPATITAAVTGGMIQNIDTRFVAAGEAGSPAFIDISGKFAATDFADISMVASTLVGFTDPNYQAPAGGGEFVGNVPIIMDFNGIWGGVTFNPLEHWPLVQIGVINQATTGTGQLTVTYLTPFPNGIGLFLIQALGWSVGPPIFQGTANPAKDKATLNVLKSQDGSGVGGGQTIIASYIAIGW